ncbi:MAG: hypothetical protein Q9160_003658 [Pyrenula sp. 1 TL-2023]
MAQTNDDGAGTSTRDPSSSFSQFPNIPGQPKAQSWNESSTSRSSSTLKRTHTSRAASHSNAEASVSQDGHRPLRSRAGAQQSAQYILAPDEATMRIPKASGLKPHIWRLLHQAPAEPPVTTRTLSELDLGSIMNNIHLRSDVNFDNDLHFMPIKGEKGESKRQRAQDYWAALAAELHIYQFMAMSRQPCIMDISCDGTFTPRLPMMFLALKELLISLVPDRDHPSITEHLDVALIMQQVGKGVLDITGLARWLANLLKCHCAPMRDAITDEMAARIEEGLSQGRSETIASGLESLFAVLEAMKLDVANHQIRTFRMLLIDDTEHFQRDHFERLINEHEFDPLPSSEWYKTSMQQLSNHNSLLTFESSNQSLHGMKPLIVGLLNHLTSLRMPKSYPSTFCHDEGRLMRLRDDIQDLIHLCICYRAFDRAVFAITRGRQYSAPGQAYTSLRARIFAILGISERMAEDDITKLWQNNISNIALEILRVAHVFYRAHNRRRPGVGVKELPAIPDLQLEKMCENLTTDMMQEERYRYYADQVEAKISHSTAIQTSHFNCMGPRGISEEQRIWMSRRSLQLRQPGYLDTFPSGGPYLPSADTEGISRRLAHMVVLNWRVWAGLCYIPYHKEAAQRTT